MKQLNILFANIYDMKDQISGMMWKCCDEHNIEIEFAANLDDMLSKLKSSKEYHGLILGNYPMDAKYTATHFIREARMLQGYENIPAVILMKSLQEDVYDLSPDMKRILIVPFRELEKEGKIPEVVHEHFLGLNQ